MNGISSAFTGTIVNAADLLFGRDSGKPYLKLRVAADGPANPAARQYVSVLAFDDLATADRAKELAEGTEVYIEGKLRLDHWTDRAGQQRTTIRVVASRIDVHGRFDGSRKALEISDQRHQAEVAELASKLEELKDKRGKDDTGATDAQVPF